MKYTESMSRKYKTIPKDVSRKKWLEPVPSISRNPMRSIEDMVEEKDNSFDGVINNVKVEPAAGTLEIVPDDKKSVLEKLKEQSKQVQPPVPVSDRKPVPECCFEREFQGW